MLLQRRTHQDGLAEAAGSRELLSLLCEQLADRLSASDCLISLVDRDRGVTVDVAGFTHTPERWRSSAGEYPLAGYPATRAVLDGGPPYTTWVGDPDGDPAEIGYLREMGVRAGLLLRMQGAHEELLVEVWSDTRDHAFGRREIRRAQRLVQRAGGLLAQAAERDREQEQAFLRAAKEAREIGAADLELADTAVAIGERLLLDDAALRQLRLVALVHEAGGSAIPPQLRAKGAPLTPVEWAVVQRHTLIGQRMLARMPYLRETVAEVGAIREHWDGNGYPHGFAGEEIPPAARIVAVCSGYRAMRRGRGDRQPLGHAEAVAELRRCAGTRFDPAVVDAAVDVIDPAGARPTVRLRVAAI